MEVKSETWTEHSRAAAVVAVTAAVESEVAWRQILQLIRFVVHAE